MPTLDSLLVEFKKMGGKLREELSRLANLTIEGFEWVDVEPSLPSSVAASDSSRHEVPLRYALLYAGQGIAVRYEGGWTGQAEGAVVDYVIMGGYRGQRAVWDGLVSNRFKTLEVSLVHRLKSGYVLFDGSYSSFLADKLPPQKEENEVLREYYEQALASWRDRINLLDEMREEGRRLVFVSKTVSRAYLTGGGRVKLGEGKLRPPDFMIVESLSKGRGAGFLWGDQVVYSVKVRNPHDLEGPREERSYTLTYVRLKPGAPLFQLTVPGKVSREEMERIVSHLSQLSPGGYPEPLAEAHHLSLLKRREFMELVRGLDVLAETGREVLEQLRRAGRP